MNFQIRKYYIVSKMTLFLNYYKLTQQISLWAVKKGKWLRQVMKTAVFSTSFFPH